MFSSPSKYTICPKCNNCPFLSLNKECPKEELIQCNNCECNKTYKIHDYLEPIDKKEIIDKSLEKCDVD